MKLARCAGPDGVFWAVVEPDREAVRPIPGPFEDWAPEFTADPARAAARYTGPPRSLAQVRLLAPVDPARTVFAGGANYGLHVAELDLGHAAKPTVFLKAHRSLIGPADDIAHPAVTGQLDHEVELVAVTGTARFDPDRPWAGVLGYAVGNDVSARDLQFAGSVTGMDIYSAKSLEHTSPVGPWIVTRDEFGDGPPDLEMTLTVNGEPRQQARTGEMIWDVAALLDYVDRRSGVGCGDLLFTGSPAGIGHTSGRYLQPGDVVVARIERIGSLVNTVGRRGTRLSPPAAPASRAVEV